jgi:hypothetical protein
MTAGRLEPGPLLPQDWGDVAEARWLYAKLCWPGDPRMQRRFVATWGAIELDAIERFERQPRLLAAAFEKLAAEAQAVDTRMCRPELAPVLTNACARVAAESPAEFARRVADAREAILRWMLEPAGGFLTLAAAPGVATLDAAAGHAFDTEGTAGEALFVLACAARHHADELPTVGVNRVLAAMEGPGRSLRLLKEAWGNARAPHGWAALLALTVEAALARGVGSLPVSAESAAITRYLAAGVLADRVLREAFRGVAAWLAEWGTSYRPAGAKRSVLDVARLVSFGDVPAREPVLFPLTPGELERMRAYRAPKAL